MRIENVNQPLGQEVREDGVAVADNRVEPLNHGGKNGIPSQVQQTEQPLYVYGRLGDGMQVAAESHRKLQLLFGSDVTLLNGGATAGTDRDRGMMQLLRSPIGSRKGVVEIYGVGSNKQAREETVRVLHENLFPSDQYTITINTRRL